MLVVTGMFPIIRLKKKEHKPNPKDRYYRNPLVRTSYSLVLQANLSSQRRVHIVVNMGGVVLLSSRKTLRHSNSLSCSVLSTVGCFGKRLGPDIFMWVGGLPREGVGAKKFGVSLETKGNQTFWWDIPGFCWISRRCPKSLRKESLCSIFGP